MGTVYLLHFQTAFKHARHYTGWASNLDARLGHHRRGTGARLLQVLAEQGIDWQLARTWKGSRQDERRIKKQHNAPRLCPICKAQAN